METFELCPILVDEDKKGKKGDDEGAGNFSRPEINGEYEDEIIDDCLFQSSILRKTEENLYLTESKLIYLFNLVPINSPNLDNEIKFFQERIDNFMEIKKQKKTFICRVYLLNISNITYDDDNREAFYWIKRYDEDVNFKQDKKYFDIEEGEINDSVSMPVKWPVIKNIKIFFRIL